jgi:hypothetical protein
MDNPRHGPVAWGAAELLGAGVAVGTADAEADDGCVDGLGAGGWGGGADEQAARLKQLTTIATVIAFADRVMVRATVAIIRYLSSSPGNVRCT